MSGAGLPDMGPPAGHLTGAWGRGTAVRRLQTTGPAAARRTPANEPAWQFDPITRRCTPPDR
jgi:hypothetical protein